MDPTDVLAAAKRVPHLLVLARLGKGTVAQHTVVATHELVLVVADRAAEIGVGAHDGAVGLKLDHGPGSRNRLQQMDVGRRRLRNRLRLTLQHKFALDAGSGHIGSPSL